MGSRGLAAGRSIFVQPLPDGSLLLRDSEEVHPSVVATLIISASEPPEHLFRRLVGAYLAGATDFVLSQPGGLTQETRGIARSFAKRTGHTESLSEEGPTLLLRDVSLGLGPSISQQLNRMFQLVHGLHVVAGRSWTSGGAHGADALATQDDEVDRYAWQIERSVRLSSLGDPSKRRVEAGSGDAYRFLLWARDLERIADHAVLIAEHGARLADASPPDTVRRMLSSYHTQALDHLGAAQRVAQSPDANRANAVLDTGEALHQTQTALADQILMSGSADRLPAAAIRSLGLILQSIDRTTGYAQNLAEIGLDRDLDRLTHPQEPSVPPVRAPADVSSKNKRGGTRKT